MIAKINEKFEDFYNKMVGKNEESQEVHQVSLKNVVKINVFKRLGGMSENEGEKDELQSGMLRKNWEDLEYRKRLLRIIKGFNYENLTEKTAT